MVDLSLDECLILLNHAPLLIWRARPDKLCDWFNEGWLQFTGRTLDQELGNGWAEGVHAEDLPRCFETYVTAFERRERFEMEYRLRRFDGAYRWILDRGTPFSLEDGQFGGYIGSCLDVTERREAQRRREDASLAEIEHLKKLLPICAWCRKVRSGDGYWTSVEEYLDRENLAHVTHGICEACARHASGDLSDDGGSADSDHPR